MTQKVWFNKNRINEMISTQEQTGKTLNTKKYNGRRYVWVGFYKPRSIKKVAENLKGRGFLIIQRNNELYAAKE